MAGRGLPTLSLLRLVSSREGLASCGVLAATSSFSSSLILSSARALSTTPTARARFRTTTPAALREIGQLLPRIQKPYECGQLFVHRLFAYKGVILCSFNCKITDKTKQGEVAVEEPQYQVLIHRGDWAHMGFPVDVTMYLAEPTTGGIPGRGEKLMTSMNGLDCVSHNDIIPFSPVERAPIDHDLFDRIFLPTSETVNVVEIPGVRYTLRPEIRQLYMQSNKSWMAPVTMAREISDGVEVTVTTFYLGTNSSSGSPKHMWRYVVRLHNQTDHSIVVRERQLKVFSFNNIHQLSGHGVIGRQPELTPSRPAFQYSSTVELTQSKGGHMWGAFKCERDNGTMFEVSIPAFMLEATGPDANVTTQTPPPPTPSPTHPQGPEISIP